MANRTLHREAVRTFLIEELNMRECDFELPHSWGKETYFARSKNLSCFIKLGAPLANYRVMASLGLTPPLIASGSLADGISILVQPLMDGRNPTWADFDRYLEKIAKVVHTMQHSPELRHSLPTPPSAQYSNLGLQALISLRQRWECYKPHVPQLAGWVDESLDRLAFELGVVTGEGVVVTHHDICNANWLLLENGTVYLVDLDDLTLDDPAADLGALLWWYYPPELRGRFLNLVGLQECETLRARMRLRMALHCLTILLPREGSFDRFDAHQFMNSLADFKAILAGEENPQGYDDDR